jgi:hypothetical protein
MNAPLPSIDVLERRLDLFDAELWIVGPPKMTGRLAGPKTRYASTIEVPFYLQKIPDPTAPAGAQRVLIPEPSLWSFETPYLYEAKLDLGSQGKAQFAWGFRRLKWTPDAFRLNGSSIDLRVERRKGLSEAEALELRAAGVRVVILPLADGAAWDIADRVGLLLIGEVGSDFEQARALRWHASALGWILDPTQSAIESLRRTGAGDPFVGVDAKAQTLPSWAEFVADATSLQRR